MNCSELDQMLYPYLDGEFGPDERLELEGHLATCPACACKVHQESAFRSAFRARAREAAAVPLPDGFHERVQEQIQAEERRARFRAVMPYAAAAALVAVAGGGWVALQMPAPILSAEAAPPSPDEKADRPYIPVPLLSNARVEGASFTYQVEMPGHGPRRVRVSVFPYDPGDFTVAQPLPRAKVFRTDGGRNVVIWREDAVVYRLEGEEDLDEADLLRMLPKVLPAEDESNLATPMRRPTVPYQPAGLRQ